MSGVAMAFYLRRIDVTPMPGARGSPHKLDESKDLLSGFCGAPYRP